MTRRPRTTRLPPAQKRIGQQRIASYVHRHPVGQGGAQLYPGSIATSTPQIFLVASWPAPRTGTGSATATPWPALLVVPRRASAKCGNVGSWGCDAEEDEGSGGVAGVVTQGGGDVAVAVETQDADGEVAQARHSLGGRCRCGPSWNAAPRRRSRGRGTAEPQDPPMPTQAHTSQGHDWLASKALLIAVRAHAIRSAISRTGQNALTVSVCAGQDRYCGRGRS